MIELTLLKEINQYNLKQEIFKLSKPIFKSERFDSLRITIKDTLEQTLNRCLDDEVYSKLAYSKLLEVRKRMRILLKEKIKNNDYTWDTIVVSKGRYGDIAILLEYYDELTGENLLFIEDCLVGGFLDPDLTKKEAVEQLIKSNFGEDEEIVYKNFVGYD